jgi:hypothetical protein
VRALQAAVFFFLRLLFDWIAGVSALSTIRADALTREARRRPGRQERVDVPTLRVEGDGMRDEKELGGQEGRRWVPGEGDKVEGGRGMKVKVSRDVYGAGMGGGRLEMRGRGRVGVGAALLVTPGVEKRGASL